MTRVLVAAAFLFIAAAAIAVWGLGYVNPASSYTSRAPTYDQQVADALSRAGPGTAGDPAVTSRDLLAIIASQQSASLRAQSDIESLLVLLILATGLFGLTAGFRRFPTMPVPSTAEPTPAVTASAVVTPAVTTPVAPTTSADSRPQSLSGWPPTRSAGETEAPSGSPPKDTRTP